jgi:glycosyltransferase involved in cell wall biosynthesis
MVVMSESARGDEARTWWKEIIKRRIVDLYCAALVGGQRHVEYLVELGMPRERIFVGYDVVDNDYFASRTREIRDSHLRPGYGGQAAFEIRKKYGLPENYFLASARFIEKKNLLRLVRAYAEYRQELEIIRLRQGYGGQGAQMSAGTDENSPWDLVLLGDGPLREPLNSQLSTYTPTCISPALGNLSDESQELIRVAMNELHLSARAHDRILKVSRTIADLDGKNDISPEHVSEAIQYRTFDRTLWV